MYNKTYSISIFFYSNCIGLSYVLLKEEILLIFKKYSILLYFIYLYAINELIMMIKDIIIGVNIKIKNNVQLA